MLKWLKEIRCPWDANACAAAAEHGRFEVLKWLKEIRCRLDAKTCAAAAMNGHLEILMWLKANGCTWNSKAYTNAAQYRHYEVLKRMRENDAAPSWDEEVCAFVAQRGDWEILKWARGQGCPWDERTLAAAAQGGHLEILKWAREQGCPWAETGGYSVLTPRAERRYGTGAVKGHLQVVIWAVENGFHVTREACEYAASNGHLEILNWLKANAWPWKEGDDQFEMPYSQHGCPCSEQGWCSTASEQDHLDVVKWAIENGCSGHKKKSQACHHAAQREYLSVLKYLRANESPWGEVVLVVAARIGHLEMFKWTLENGCPCTKAVWVEAVRCSQIPILEWAFRNRCPWEPLSCYRNWIKKGGRLQTWAQQEGCW